MVASPGPDQRVHVGCIVGRLAQAARRNPAQVFAVLAGIAFVCLLGTFVAQVVLAIVSGVSAPAPYHPRFSALLGNQQRTSCQDVLQLAWHQGAAAEACLRTRKAAERACLVLA